MQLETYFAETRGAQAELARALGVPQSLPSAWAAADPEKRRPVPVQHCQAIVKATNGAVTLRDLRPDDWRLIWPELEEPTDQQATAPARGEAQESTLQEVSNG